MPAITTNQPAQLDAAPVSFELDGRAVTARADEPLIEIALREGVAIAHLCYRKGLDAVGNCRACMVEIAGERVLAASCCRLPTAGMQVTTDSARALKSQRLVLELLQSDLPEQAYTRHNEVDHWARKLGLGKPRWDVDLLADLSSVMRDASICGLGQAAPNPIDCVVKYFAHELA